MIEFDFSNATEPPCRAARPAEKGYAACNTTPETTAAASKWPRVGPRLPADRRRVGSDRELEQLLLGPTSITPPGDHEQRVKKVIQPSRRGFSVPVNGCLATEDTPNRTLIAIPGAICHPRSTHGDRTFADRRDLATQCEVTA